MAYGFLAFGKRPLLTALLRPRLRTGFEGIEAAITRAAAIARGDDPDAPLPGDNGSVRGVRGRARPAADGELAGPRRRCSAAGHVRGIRVAVVLIGVALLYRAWHNRRVAGQPG